MEEKKEILKNIMLDVGAEINASGSISIAGFSSKKSQNVSKNEFGDYTFTFTASTGLSYTIGHSSKDNCSDDKRIPSLPIGYELIFDKNFVDFNIKIFTNEGNFNFPYISIPEGIFSSDNFINKFEEFIEHKFNMMNNMKIGIDYELNELLK